MSSSGCLYSFKNYTVPADTGDVITVGACQPYEEMIVLEAVRGALPEKGIALSRSLVTLCKGKAEVWAVNITHNPQLLLKRICVASVETPSLLPHSLDTRITSVQPQGSTRAVFESQDVQEPSDTFRVMVEPCLEGAENVLLVAELKKCSTAFDFDSPSLAKATTVTHSIKTGDACPLHPRPYRVSSSERATIQKEVTLMLKKNIIQPSSSPWSLPYVLIRRRDRSWRFCVNY